MSEYITYKNIKVSSTFLGKEGELRKRTKEGIDKFLEVVKERGHTIVGVYQGDKKKIEIDYHCGHEPSFIIPNAYKRGQGCKECQYDVIRKRGEESLRKEIEKNNHKLLSPYQDAHKKVKIDIGCEHGYIEISPNSYLRGSRCRKCAGLCTIEAKKKFHKTVKENGHKLFGEYNNDNTKVMIDIGCGHGSFPITPRKYLQGRRCPRCHDSNGEKIIKEWLKKNNYKFEEQFSLDGKPYKYDIFLDCFEKGLLIEVNGRQHYEYVEHYHNPKKRPKNNTFEFQQKRDRDKEEYARLNGYDFMVIDYREHKPKIALKRFIKQFNDYKRSC